MTRTRWLQLALVLSLAINLLVAGAILGRFRDHAPPLDWATEPLDPEARDLIRPMMRERVTKTIQMRRELRRAQARIRDLMTDDSLDEAALAEELAGLRALSGEYQRVMHETAVEIMAQLTPEQRLRVARRLLTPHPEGPPPDGRSRGERVSPPGERRPSPAR
jgi:uncharacterized membrane protein